MRKLPLIAAGAVVVGAVLWVRKNPSRTLAPGVIANPLDPRFWQPEDVVSGKVAEIEAGWTPPPVHKDKSLAEVEGAAAAAAVPGFLLGGPLGAALAFAATWIKTSGVKVGFGENGPTKTCHDHTGAEVECEGLAASKCYGPPRPPCVSPQLREGWLHCDQSKRKCDPYGSSGKWVKQ